MKLVSILQNMLPDADSGSIAFPGSGIVINWGASQILNFAANETNHDGMNGGLRWVKLPLARPYKYDENYKVVLGTTVSEVELPDGPVISMNVIANVYKKDQNNIYAVVQRVDNYGTAGSCFVSYMAIGMDKGSPSDFN